MTFREELFSDFGAALWQRSALRRALPLLLAVGVLLVIGIYTVTDPERLDNHIVLEGADWAGYALCHRITERSFTIAGRQLPLCARCTGMYLGVLLVFVVMALSARLHRAKLPRLPLVLVLLGFVGAMAVDGLNSYSHFFPNAPHLYEPRNWLRLLTGMGTGLALAVITLPSLAETLWRHPDHRPILTGSRELTALVIAAFVVVLLVLSNQPAVLYVLAVGSTVGLLLILTALNTVIMLVVLRRDGRAATWSQAAVPLVIALVFTVLELAAVAAVRFSLTGTMTGFPGL